MNRDYLKYWRVISYFIKSKYNLKQAELDTLLFLNSESYFSKEKFKEFNELLSWNKRRFDILLRDGWIEVFRKRSGVHKTLYQLSYKSQRVLKSIYDKLEGTEIPDSQHNPMFHRNVSYTDKVYRNMIKEMNKTIRQQRHSSQE